MFGWWLARWSVNRWFIERTPHRLVRSVILKSGPMQMNWTSNCELRLNCLILRDCQTDCSVCFRLQRILCGHKEWLLSGTAAGDISPHQAVAKWQSCYCCSINTTSAGPHLSGPDKSGQGLWRWSSVWCPQVRYSTGTDMWLSGYNVRKFFNNYFTSWTIAIVCE